MNTLPAVVSNALIVYDANSFENQSLEWQVHHLNKQANEQLDRLSGAQDKIQMVLSFMSFNCRDVIRHLDEETAVLKRLQGLPDHEFFEPEDPDDTIRKKNTPEEGHERKRAPRYIEAELKNLYRKLSARCHPDRCKDRNLLDYMPLINQFYALHDVDTLRLILESVDDYIKNKRDRKKMAKFYQEKVRSIRNTLTSYTHQLENLKKSPVWEVVTAYETGNGQLARQKYEEILYNKISDVKVAIAQIRATRNANKPRTFSPTVAPEWLKKAFE